MVCGLLGSVCELLCVVIVVWAYFLRVKRVERKVSPTVGLAMDNLMTLAGFFSLLLFWWHTDI